MVTTQDLSSGIDLLSAIIDAIKDSFGFSPEIESETTTLTYPEESTGLLTKTVPLSTITEEPTGSQKTKVDASGTQSSSPQTGTPAGTASPTEEQDTTVDKSVATTVQELSDTGKTDFVTKATSSESISVETVESAISTKTTASQQTDTQQTTTQKGTTGTDTQESVEDRTTVDIITPKVTITEETTDTTETGASSTATETGVESTTRSVTQETAVDNNC